MHPQTTPGTGATRRVRVEDGARAGATRSVSYVAFLVVTTVVFLSSSLGCGGSDDLPNIENSAPTIESVAAEADTVTRGQTIEFSCVAEDAQGDPLSYSWSASAGGFLGARDESTIRWKAPEDADGSVKITVVASDGKAESTPAEATVVVLGAVGNLSGTVTAQSDGEPLEGVSVRIAGASTVTDAAGAYSFSSLAIGSFTLEASLDGYQTFSAPFEVKEGSNERDIVLIGVEEVGTVTGTVTNSRGAPVVGATCRIGAQQGSTDGNGRFSLGAVTRGNFVLQVSRSGYDFSSNSGTLDGPEATVDVVLNAARPGRATNVVATKSGLDMTLRWDALPEDTVDEYQVYWRLEQNSTEAMPGGRVPASTREVQVQGESDRRYRFFVSALNIDGEEGDAVPSNDLVLAALSAWVEIPAGAVVIGDGVPGQSDDATSPHPGNPVSVEGFRIERTEVTNRQFHAFLWEARSVGAIEIVDGQARQNGNLLIHFNASKVRYEAGTGGFSVTAGFESHPVAGVTWYGARAYADFYGRRLPTEVEWEKAARGTSTAAGTYPGSNVGYGTRYPWGNAAPTSMHANFDEQTGTTRAVGSLAGGATIHWSAPVYELAGNVWEWCQDWMGPYQDPHQPPSSGTRKVLRGGSFLDEPVWLSSWVRYSFEPSASSPATGFRCAAD